MDDIISLMILSPLWYYLPYDIDLPLQKLVINTNTHTNTNNFILHQITNKKHYPNAIFQWETKLQIVTLKLYVDDSAKSTDITLS